MAPFQPAGEVARWRVVYDLLREVPTGEILTYEVVGKALDLDPDMDRHRIQMAVRPAAKHHEEWDKRSVEAVANEGYRVVETPEKLRLARNDQKKSSRALARGQSKVVNVDLNGLDQDTRKAFEIVAIAFAEQREFVRRLDIRQTRLEEAVKAVSTRSDRTEQEIAELKERLARLEGKED
jgi:hypothetical protein